MELALCGGKRGKEGPFGKKVINGKYGEEDAEW